MVEGAVQSSYLGNMGSVLFDMSKRHARRWSFANRGQRSPEQWREEARRVLLDRLSFLPESVPLRARTVQQHRFPGYVQEWVDFAGTDEYRITGVLLIPDSGAGPFPAVVALHDHGGFFHYGKEKITEPLVELPIRKERRNMFYQGRAWASELARRGYVVLVIDALGWGIRNITTPSFKDPFSYSLTVDEEEAAYERNVLAITAAGHLDMHLAYAGLSWAGIINWDDRRSVDYLVSRKEVDPNRIACVGLSGGGHRSTYLFGTDPRITCAGIVGWMTCLSYQLVHDQPYHLGLFTAPCVYREMDHPDIAGLGAPKPLFVQQCTYDILYPLEAMVKSCEYLESIYEAYDATDAFVSEFYDVEHSFTIAMQEEMFEWLDIILDNTRG